MVRTTKMFFAMIAVSVMTSSAFALVNPENYTCKQTKDQVCAQSKITGQCTLSWDFEEGNIFQAKDALFKCQKQLGLVKSSFKPENYTCKQTKDQVCAQSKITGQCGQSWDYEEGDVVDAKTALYNCQKYLGLVKSTFNPDNYFCSVSVFGDEVCAKSKIHGQCTHSWTYEKDNALAAKEAMQKCINFLD